MTTAQVTAILVLFGLPWLLTGSILAHEVMHAWLHVNGFRGLAPEVEEGLCQLMALLWLEGLPSEAEVGPNPPHTQPPELGSGHR